VARRIPDPERQRILEVLDAPENVDQPPAEIYARLLSAGIYLASVRTLYRILAERNQVRERRGGHVVRRHEVPRLCATGSNQVWTWDITKVPGVERGSFFYLYVILDLFSRYIVGWLAAERENARLASSLIAETAARHAIAPDALTVHSDRGAPMTAGSMTQLLATLQIEQSFSRPRVSDDNAFVESAFKTVKYQPDYPGSANSPTGTATTTITQGSRSSPQLMSSIAVWPPSPPCASARLITPTQPIPTASSTARQGCPCPRPASPSTPSRTTARSSAPWISRRHLSVHRLNAPNATARKPGQGRRSRRAKRANP
jgi:transposase InsO family protein